MQDPATFSNDKLLELFRQQSVLLADSQTQLAGKDDELATKNDELAAKDDIIRQLEQKHEALEPAYEKLWRERFAARSERRSGGRRGPDRSSQTRQTP